MFTSSDRSFWAQPTRIVGGSWRLLAALTLAVVALNYLVACETTEGAGRDIKKLGNNIEDSAQEHKP
jgi:predicted small secreted protein